MGGVLIGGGSRRMGRPKHLIDTGDSTMVEQVVAALKPIVESVVLLGRGELPSTMRHLHRVPDADGCRGPLAGILAALRHAPDACWIIAACDMPLIKSDAINWLLGERRSSASMVLPNIDGRIEPLLALYEPAALALLEAAVDAGELAPRHMARHDSVRCVEPPAQLRPRWFNANTPADLARISHRVSTAGGESRRPAVLAANRAPRRSATTTASPNSRQTQRRLVLRHPRDETR